MKHVAQKYIKNFFRYQCKEFFCFPTKDNVKTLKHA